MGNKYSVKAGDTLWGIAEQFYGDGRRHRVIAVANDLADPDDIVVGQELAIPYVTYRYQVRAGDRKADLARRFYHDVAMTGVYEVASGAAQRPLEVGEWLVVPDLADAGHHTMAEGETLETLAGDWYGVPAFWTIIAIANRLGGPVHPPGTLLTRPRMNRRRSVVVGDTLWRLATDEYGDYGADRTLTAVKLTAAANLITDPDHVEVGRVVHFPSMWP